MSQTFGVLGVYGVYFVAEVVRWHYGIGILALSRGPKATNKTNRGRITRLLAFYFGVVTLQQKILTLYSRVLNN